MLNFRGINVHAVSQIEARRLPEYNTAQAVDANPVAACYIPTIPGAQIWFEYSIDGPHPPNAMYLFKLFIDGRHVTTWDCTAKHTYHGKVAYSLHVVKSGHYGGRAVVQNSLMFSVPEGRQSPATRDDCIEIRVHRIQKRRRIRQLALDTPIPKHLQERSQRAVRLADAGLIEPGRPARRYQYLLLDPQDEPYATFRFYCRSPEYLAVHNLLGIDRSLSPTSLATSSNYVDADSSPWRQENGRRPLYSPERSPWSSPHFHGPEVSPQRSLRGASVEEDVFSICSPPSPKTKDSIEDLPSSVPRSPQAVEVPSRSSFQPNDNLAPHSPSQQSSPLLPELDGLSIGVADSPTVSRPANENVLPSTSINTRDLVALPRTDSPRPAYQRHKPSSLKLTLDGGALDVSNQPPRPLSPFTRAGFLRRLTSSEAASRPTPAPRAASAEPSVPTHEETERYSKTTSGSSKEEQEGKQSKAQRSGHPFLGFLGRRSDRRSAT
ncbi:hypothetical protein OHC33_008462 [Knufia fluminis]|uniref:Uncharacterized protein n=2 Tax=Knufia TaxID=430999 RepID=A0AAN8EAD9_9EURO|nr:hypothetical protein OHC33_008462 [Knufia fluminis]